MPELLDSVRFYVACSFHLRILHSVIVYAVNHLQYIITYAGKYTKHFMSNEPQFSKNLVFIISCIFYVIFSAYAIPVGDKRNYPFLNFCRNKFFCLHYLPVIIINTTKIIKEKSICAMKSQILVELLFSVRL